MLVYVDLEHDQLRQYPDQWEASLARRLKHKYQFEDITGDHCLILRYPHANPAVLRDLKARAVLVSGCSSDFDHYREADLAGLRAIFCEATHPLIGFCAGHQLLAQAYGAPIAAMGASDQPMLGDQHFPDSGYVAGAKFERGFQAIQVSAPQPLFAGLSAKPVFFESHYWEVKAPPPAFRPVAHSALCPIQTLVHESRPLFGTQFHPEEYDDAHRDGRQLLINFFRLAGYAI